MQSFGKAFPDDTFIAYKYKYRGEASYSGIKLLDVLLKDEYRLSIYKLSRSKGKSMGSKEIESIANDTIMETKDELNRSKRCDILRKKLKSLFPTHNVNVFLFEDGDWARDSRNIKGTVFFVNNYESDIDIVLS